MDFEYAAKRLAKDQSKLKGRRKVEVSAKAKREAEMRKKLEERMQQERQAKQRDKAFREQYMTQCERSLGVKSLSAIGPLQLQPTSIHGQGDKIALPPSVLQYLTSSGQDTITSGSPWTFRVGILNSDYNFPASDSMQMLTAPLQLDESESQMDEEYDDSEDEDEGTDKAVYLQELKHKYHSVTYGSVVEFTQEEGDIGLPEPIAAALLDPARRGRSANSVEIPVTRTIDPAAAAATAKGDGDDLMTEDDEKTPGHLAWGAFDVPNLPIEVSLVRLPKGRGCTLVPTAQAVQNGFYDLKDVKLVLEQSLIRTRATLSVNDMVHTWHRGKKYDLRVTKVIPPTYGAITCINTELEVDLGEAEGIGGAEQATTPVAQVDPSVGQTLGSSFGRRLNDEPAPTNAPAPVTVTAANELLPEPPADCTEGICTVQIRADGAHGRRRFDVRKAAMKDLFAFAETLTKGEHNFRLVTRFPRNVFTRDSETTTLIDSGIQSGQELFLVEKM